MACMVTENRVRFVKILNKGVNVIYIYHILTKIIVINPNEPETNQEK